MVASASPLYYFAPFLYTTSNFHVVLCPLPALDLGDATALPMDILLTQCSVLQFDPLLKALSND